MSNLGERLEESEIQEMLMEADVDVEQGGKINYQGMWKEVEFTKYYYFHYSNMSWQVVWCLLYIRYHKRCLIMSHYHAKADPPPLRSSNRVTEGNMQRVCFLHLNV